ncbi:MAG: hypothetical protein RR145_01410, partial [Oscillospiraceae bacterium]
VIKYDSVLKTAKKINILGNIEIETSITYSNFIRILYNTLETKMLIKTIYGDEERYETNAEKTFISEILGIKADIGIVEGDANTKLSVPNFMESDEVIINKKIFKVGISRANEFLGSRIKYYYRFTKDGSNEVLVYASDDKYNKVMELKDEDIVRFENGAYECRDGNRIKKEKISKSADIIYNGKAGSAPFDKYVPSIGYVKLVDNNLDGENDVVIIKEYYTLVVKAVNVELFSIEDKYDGSRNVKLDPYDPELRYKIMDSDKNLIHISQIKEGSILSVAKSDDEKLLEIIVSNRTVDGVLENVNKNYVIVDGVQHRAVSGINAKAGDYGTFRFDYRSVIVEFDKKKAGKEFSGYLVGVAENGGLDDTVEFKMFDESNKFGIYKSAKKVKIDDVAKTPKEIKNALTRNGTKDISQLVLFKLNGKGEVSEIDCATDYTKEFGATGFRQDSVPNTRLAHKMENFSGAFREDPFKTKVFIVPNDVNDEDSFKYYSRGKDYFKFNTYYTVTAYAVEEDLSYAEYVVVHLNSSAGSAEDFDPNIMIVEDVASSLSESGEEIQILYGLHNKQSVGYPLKNTEELEKTKFNSGDIVKILKNENGTIIAANKLYDGDTKLPVGTNPSSPDQMSEYRYILANVYSTRGKTLFVTTKSPENVVNKDDGEYIFSDLYRDVYRYDSKSKKVYVASSGDVKNYLKNPSEYSKVFVYHHYSDPELMVICE